MAWSWRRHIYVAYSAAAYVCFLLVLLGLAGASWVEGTASGVTSQYGLLSHCHHYGDNERLVCGSYGDMPVWFDFSRTFCFLSAVFLFAIMPTTIYLHYNDDKKDDVTLVTVLGVFTGVLGLFGAILYAAFRDPNQGGMTWAFGVYVAGHVTAVIVFISFCAYVSQTKNAPRMSKVKPQPDGPWRP